MSAQTENWVNTIEAFSAGAHESYTFPVIGSLATRYESILGLDEKTFMLLQTPFHVKLFYILNATSKSPEQSKFLSWDNSGLSFTIRDIESFQESILPKYFKRKFTSFDVFSILY